MSDLRLQLTDCVLQYSTDDGLTGVNDRSLKEAACPSRFRPLQERTVVSDDVENWSPLL
jgi:hypothetical protein